ncbi:hypothetical protein BDV26DRAFT_253456 [Aspergillus bertholletiae]|uniref:Uncharacterized protein n=1 Tax=Aspergillus bertholletiae TaxID=1226010 RepID=A0A5N7BKX8_9EURO|nr:hypothetical protein BDV26DRAFT_253456 [Aspergillus bertholletiae]
MCKKGIPQPTVMGRSVDLEWSVDMGHSPLACHAVVVLQIANLNAAIGVCLCTRVQYPNDKNRPVSDLEIANRDFYRRDTLRGIAMSYLKQLSETEHLERTRPRIEKTKSDGLRIISFHILLSFSPTVGTGRPRKPGYCRPTEPLGSGSHLRSQSKADTMSLVDIAGGIPDPRAACSPGFYVLGVGLFEPLDPTRVEGYPVADQMLIAAIVGHF